MQHNCVVFSKVKYQFEYCHFTQVQIFTAIILTYHNIHSAKGATKSYFMHYPCVVIVLFNTDLCRSAFSTISFGKLVFRLSFVFFILNKIFWIQDIKISVINIWKGPNCRVILFSLYKNSPYKYQTIYKRYIVWKTCFQTGFEFFKKKIIYKEKYEKVKQ